MKKQKKNLLPQLSAPVQRQDRERAASEAGAAGQSAGVGASHLSVSCGPGPCAFYGGDSAE